MFKQPAFLLQTQTCFTYCFGCARSLRIEVFCIHEYLVQSYGRSACAVEEC
jgi:hypothetical protein